MYRTTLWASGWALIVLKVSPDASPGCWTVETWRHTERNVHQVEISVGRSFCVYRWSVLSSRLPCFICIFNHLQSYLGTLLRLSATSSVASMLTGLWWTEIHLDRNRIYVGDHWGCCSRHYFSRSQPHMLLVTLSRNERSDTRPWLMKCCIHHWRILFFFSAEHLISRYWLPEADWSRWWAQAAYFLWEENGHRGGCWPFGWWVEGKMIEGKNLGSGDCLKLGNSMCCIQDSNKIRHSADPFRLVHSH